MNYRIYYTYYIISPFVKRNVDLQLVQYTSVTNHSIATLGDFCRTDALNNDNRAGAMHVDETIHDYRDASVGHDRLS
jgi:hypothetical protein